jgi:hypothetical protein
MPRRQGSDPSPARRHNKNCRVRPRAATTKIAGPEGARLTAEPSLTHGSKVGLTPGSLSLAPAGVNARYLLVENTVRAKRPRNSGPNGPERPPSTAISPARSLPFQPTSTHTMLDFGE